jgi:uncharacterized SAM-binding protein YcdF (DUF218 family)
MARWRCASLTSTGQMTDDEIPLKAPGAIVLLGHHSHNVSRAGLLQAELSIVAIARCEKAAALAQQYPDYVVLPTGGFGTFNKTLIPHGELLREHLITLGIPPDRILHFTNSANTLEDSLCARTRLVGLGGTKIIVVTSDYHLARASYIFRRNMRDFDLMFVAADGSAVDSVESLKETQKLKKLQNEWVDVPLYGPSEANADVLFEAYRQAAAEHKHYDTISAAVISGLFIAFGFPYTLGSRRIGETFLFIFSAGAIFFLLLIYDRMAWNARIARRVLHSIETQLGGGFALSYLRQDKFEKPSRLKKFVERGVSITRAVNFIGAVMLIIQILFAVLYIL